MQPAPRMPAQAGPRPAGDCSAWPWLAFQSSGMPARARRCSLLLVAALLALACVVPAASADDRGISATPPRIPAADPLNGGFLLVNMHGMLFHPLDSDIQEDVAYARWLGSGIIRV